MDAIYESLKRRAQTVVESLNKLEGITCNQSEGAMYAFPQIKLPAGASKARRIQSLRDNAPRYKGKTG